MKAKLKKVWSKLYFATAAAMIGITIPQKASAAPSTYVNKISDGLFGEILAVAPKIALVVIGWGVIMYIVSGDEHKKSKHKSTAIIAACCLLVLLVLEPLMNWFGGLV